MTNIINFPANLTYQAAVIEDLKSLDTLADIATTLSHTLSDVLFDMEDQPLSDEDTLNLDRTEVMLYAAIAAICGRRGQDV